jgi:hypothetical protein
VSIELAAGADLFVVVKCEHDIGPAFAGQRSVRT